MQYGAVTESLEASVSLTVSGRNGATERISFLIDTGFYGELALPQVTIDRLDLARSDRSAINLTMADGTTSGANTYSAYVLWHGRRREVEVINLETDFFIGMRLLSGRNLNVDAVPGGAVVITELSALA